MSASLAGRPLTAAELAVLRHAAHGYTYAHIGRLLGYQEKSVSKMALRAARKLGARSITNAVHIATVAQLVGARPDCGERAAYLRHRRRGETACPACKAANARHGVAQRAGQLKDAA
jgi:DNA-binding CsgD family transcriptional regulator